MPTVIGGLPKDRELLTSEASHSFGKLLDSLPAKVKTSLKLSRESTFKVEPTIKAKPGHTGFTLPGRFSGGSSSKPEIGR
jgi:hypothetical protein